MQLRGRFRMLFLYDVAESIDLEKLRDLLGSRGGSAEHTFPRRTPEYVRFEQTPVVEPGEVVNLHGGVKAACPVKYYGFGVIVIQVEVPFETDWRSLVEQCARWMDAPDVEPPVTEMVRQRIDQIRPAVVKPTEVSLHESYLVTEIHEIHDQEGKQPVAADLLLSHGEELVQLIRGETVPLSSKGREEMLNASLSYYPSDLVVIGSHGAVVCDRSEEAAAAAQVLEYAKMQLLEFRS